MTIPERFLRFVGADENGCLIWQGYGTRNGYGQFSLNGRNAMAHRVAYEIFVGPIPEGLQTDHLCRMRRCVNPAHLELVTQSENLRRGTWPPKRHCRNGHVYTPETTGVSGRGYRRCLICYRANRRRGNQRAREKLVVARQSSLREER